MVDVRQAAEVLLSQSGEVGQSVPPSQMGSTSQSISSLDQITVALSAPVNGRMSVVRRFFCLFVLFDLLLTSLTWLICIMLMGDGDLINTLTEQVVHYHIQTSLFDIAMLAALRFAILLLAYGAFHINSRVAVVFSTLGTCVFIIFKVIYFDWASAKQPAFQVCIILISFVVSWIEVWFLDCRVLPQEELAIKYLAQVMAGPYNSQVGPSIPAPNTNNFLGRLTSGDDMTSVGNFYSPLGSQDGSDDEISTMQEYELEELRGRTRDLMETTWEIVTSTGWSLAKRAEEDTVYVKEDSVYGKMYMLVGTVSLPPKKLLNDLFYNIEAMTSWNKSIIESKRVHIIDDNTDIVYQVSAPGANGLIGSRDFVNLRHWSAKEGSYMAASISVPVRSLPPVRNYVRADNGPSCWLMRPGPSPDTCKLQFLVNTNLKLKAWIPQTLLENAMTSVMLEFTAALRRHILTTVQTMKTSTKPLSFP